MAEYEAQAPVYGKNAVVELLKSGGDVDTVLLSGTMQEKQAAFLIALARKAGAVVKQVPTEKLNTLCPHSHQGVLAYAAQVEYVAPEDLLQIAQDKGEEPFLLLADGIEDPHNLGALMRSALLCGVHGIIIPKRGAVSVTPTVLKASAGAAAVLPVARVPNLGEAVRKLKRLGVFVWCADMRGGDFHAQELSGPIALVVGAEGKGVSSLIKKTCDGTLCIPMAAKGGVDSLNVSVAGGILMYDIFRKRLTQNNKGI